MTSTFVFRFCMIFCADIFPTIVPIFRSKLVAMPASIPFPPLNDSRLGLLMERPSSSLYTRSSYAIFSGICPFGGVVKMDNDLILVAIVYFSLSVLFKGATSLLTPTLRPTAHTYRLIALHQYSERPIVRPKHPSYSVALP